MSAELILPLAQLAAVLFLAAWLSVGVFENLFQPDLNRTFTDEVLDFSRMRADYPDAYAKVAWRRITNPRLRRLLFGLIVCWETVAAAALWWGAGALALALWSGGDLAAARGWAMLGVLLFTATWAGFLIVGNWFCYWFCHEGAQNTHYQMTLWGMASLILLAQG